MPIVLLVALAGSLALHGIALFGTDIELFAGGQEPLPPLRAELMPAAPPALPPPRPAPAKAPPKPVARPAHAAPATPPPEPAPEAAPEAAPEPEAPPVVEEPPPPPPPAKPVLPVNGVLRYAIVKESLGLQVGRAEHRWEFFEDGRYRLTGITETSGLAALIVPARIEMVSEGRMAPGGLQPERLHSVKNGRDANENADFDWAAHTVSLSRDGSVRPIAPGSQDILSLNYQLAFLGHLAEGAQIGVVTGKKYERYVLDSLGEENLETPAGCFRTLHLRALTDSSTEIWVALDRQRLPVKIRFTDKKGETFVQTLTELGSAAETSR